MTGLTSLGTATATPGKLQYGEWTAFEHPTGLNEFLPVILAQGLSKGPCLWLTAGIHGPEHSGPLAIHGLLSHDLLAELRGTIVAIPALSPAGLRTKSREPYHALLDPNRLWPDGRPSRKTPDDRPSPTSLEIAFQRLFERIRRTADLLVDLHNAWEGSIPFVLEDRVLYQRGVAGDRDRARQLADRIQAMAQAFGWPIVREFPAERYVEDNLHRSTSGAAVQLARIPALTVELGSGLRPDPAIVSAAVAGIRNVMRWAGMLPGELETLSGISFARPAFPCRRRSTPRTPVAGVAHHTVRPGELVRRGDPVATMRDIWGRPLLDEPLRAEADALVLGLSPGALFYPGQPVATLAIRDDEPPVGPYPRGYFKVQERKPPKRARSGGKKSQRG